MYQFPEKKLQEIKSSIDKALDSQGAEPIAAFDADGTLWATDMGESFFKYQFKNKLLPDLPENPWENYLTLKKNNRTDAYLWLAQINKGLSIEQVRTWASEAVKTHPDMGTFGGQKEIINHLHLRGVKVFIVTASIKWAIEPAAEIFKIPRENVIGVQTKIENNIVSLEQDGPITHGQGKVEGLLLGTKGKKAFFASGNSKSDLALLKSSTHIRLVVNSASLGHRMYDTEKAMIEIAKQNNWFWHCFN